MIAHAIAAARVCGLFEHIVVSTDDVEIGALAREEGAVVPFVRPQQLADDYTPTVAVVAHALQACESMGWLSEFVCCLYPAAPFVESEDLVGALGLLKSSGSRFCFPVTEFPSAVQRGLRRESSGKLTPFQPEHELTRSQDLEKAYYDAGQFYWGTRDAWLQSERIHSHAVGYLIPSWRVVDIDTPDDWLRAELIYSALKRGHLK
jgi:pseudaminic acid cytidylyltransferase